MTTASKMRSVAWDLECLADEQDAGPRPTDEDLRALSHVLEAVETELRRTSIYAFEDDDPHEAPSNPRLTDALSASLGESGGEWVLASTVRELRRKVDKWRGEAA